MDLFFRESEPGDVSVAADAVFDMWFRKDYGEDMGGWVSDAYAAICYGRADVRITAVLDGIPEGVCFASSGKVTMDDTSPLETYSGREGYDRAVHDIGLLHRADDELRSRYAIGTDAEIILLIVGKRSRGLGVGRKLLSEACDALRERGCGDFMLFTDDDCDFGFYDRIGMERAGSVTVDFNGYPLERIAYTQRLRWKSKYPNCGFPHR